MALVVLVIFERRHTGTPFTGEWGLCALDGLFSEQWPLNGKRRRSRLTPLAPRRGQMGLCSCPIRPWFVLSHNMPMVKSTSNWLVRHGSNAGHSSGVAQGQRSLNRCSGRDFQHEVFAPTATAAFHSQTVAAGMLLQQRPTRRVLSCATAKLLRDEAESMVPNIDPEQVRKLAGWGLTQNDIASFVGCSQSLVSLRF